MFGLSVVSARVLGRDGFAVMSLGLVMAQAWSVVAVGGTDVSIARLIAGRSDDSVGRYFSSGMLIALVFSALAIILGVGTSVGVSSLSSLPTEFAAASGIIGAALGLRIVLERAASGHGVFRRQAQIKACEGFALAAFLIAGLVLFDENIWAPLCAVGAAALLAAVLYGIALRKQLVWSAVDLSSIREVLRGARHAAAVMVVAFVLAYGDKLFLGVNVSTAEYGLYAAYYAGSVMVAMQIAFVLQNVLLNKSAGASDARTMAHRLTGFWPKAAIPLYVCLCVGLVVVLLMFGSDFPIQMELVAAFALWACLYLINMTFSTVVIGSSTTNLRKQARFSTFRGATLIVGFTALYYTESISIWTVFCVMFAIECLESLNQVRLVRRHVLTA